MKYAQDNEKAPFVGEEALWGRGISELSECLPFFKVATGDCHRLRSLPGLRCGLVAFAPPRHGYIHWWTLRNNAPPLPGTASYAPATRGRPGWTRQSIASRPPRPPQGGNVPPRGPAPSAPSQPNHRAPPEHQTLKMQPDDERILHWMHSDCKSPRQFRNEIRSQGLFPTAICRESTETSLIQRPNRTAGHRSDNSRERLAPPGMAMEGPSVREALREHIWVTASLMLGLLPTKQEFRDTYRNRSFVKTSHVRLVSHRR